MKIIYTEESKKNLIKIYEHIAKDSPLSAKKVVSAIHAVMGHLINFPLMGVATATSNIRKLVLSTYTYTIYYQYFEESDEVRILHIKHSKQNFNIK